ncbi:MAG: hypothetical protein WCQ32_02085 [bacterium]
MKSTFTKILILICIMVIAIQSSAQDDTTYNVVQKDQNGKYTLYKVNKIKQYPLFVLDSSLTQKEVDSMSNFVTKIYRNFDTVYYSVFWLSVRKVHVQKISYEAYGKVQPDLPQQYYIKTVVRREEFPEIFLWKNLLIWIGSVIVLFFVSYSMRTLDVTVNIYAYLCVCCFGIVLMFNDVFMHNENYCNYPGYKIFIPPVVIVLLGFLFKFLFNKYLKKK